MADVTLTESEREALYNPIGNDDAYPELPGVVAEIVTARIAAALGEVEARLAEAWSQGHEHGVDYQGDGYNCDTHDPEDDNPYSREVRGEVGG